MTPYIPIIISPRVSLIIRTRSHIYIPLFKAKKISPYNKFMKVGYFFLYILLLLNNEINHMRA